MSPIEVRTMPPSLVLLIDPMGIGGEKPHARMGDYRRPVFYAITAKVGSPDQGARRIVCSDQNVRPPHESEGRIRPMRRLAYFS
jgi:hypothetical protein